MIVLGMGESRERKGAELEHLTRRLLEEMGYQNIVTNKIDSGGSEIDVCADYTVRSPGGDVQHRLLCECKAHKSPIDTSDWLKFLGKVYQEQSLLGHEVFACLIALAGANGNVQGSYDKLPLRGRNVHLVSGDTLSELVKRAFGVTGPADVLASVAPLTDRTHRAIEMAYFGGAVYWVVLYGDDEYTLLDGVGKGLPMERAAALKTHVEAELAANRYVDLQEEAKAQHRALLAQKAVLGGLMEGGGTVSLEQLRSWYMEPTVDELVAAAEALARRGWTSTEGNHRWRFGQSVEHEVERRAEMIRFFMDGPVYIRALGCEWYDRHMTVQLVDEACRIQCGVPLADDEKATALRIMRWSPTALLWALTPDPMIVTHRNKNPVPDEVFDKADRREFLHSLHRSLISDFEGGKLKEYFYQIRNLRELDRTQTVVVKSEDGISHEGVIRRRTIIGQADESIGGGLITVLGIEEAPEPWEMRKKRGQ